MEQCAEPPSGEAKEKQIEKMVKATKLSSVSFLLWKSL